MFSASTIVRYALEAKKNYNSSFLLRLWLLSCWCLAKPMRQELRWIEAWDFGFPSTLPGLPMGRESRPT